MGLRFVRIFEVLFDWTLVFPTRTQTFFQTNSFLLIVMNKERTDLNEVDAGMVATALGILSVLMSPGFHSAHICCLAQLSDVESGTQYCKVLLRLTFYQPLFLAIFLHPILVGFRGGGNDTSSVICRFFCNLLGCSWSWLWCGHKCEDGRHASARSSTQTEVIGVRWLCKNICKHM